MVRSLLSLMGKVRSVASKLAYCVKLGCGLFFSWLWFMSHEVEDPNHFYCPHIGERMICQYCPHHVKNETKKYTEWYCELAYKKLMEGKS